MRLFRDFSKFLTELLTEIGGSVKFFIEIMKTAVHEPYDKQTFMTQIYHVTMNSLVTTAASGFFVGAIMTVQFSAQLKSFDTLSVLGGLATSGTIRELGPLLIAFMLSGKVGAYTSAELGTMRVTEQIDAMRCLGTNPMAYLVLPRFFGIVISTFFLLIAGLMMSILGGMVFGVLVANMGPFEYISNIPTYVTWASVVGGLFKCIVFGVLLATICTYRGYTTTGGAKGVGRTVVITALTTMVGLNLADWLTSYLLRAVNLVFGVGGG